MRDTLKFSEYVDDILLYCAENEVPVLDRLPMHCIHKVLKYRSHSILRVFLADALANDSANLCAQMILFALTKDAHWLVRCAAITSLSSFVNIQVLSHALSMAKKEKHTIVRTAAIDTATSLILQLPNNTDIQNSFLIILDSISCSENTRLRIQAGESLFRLGKMTFSELCEHQLHCFQQANYVEKRFIMNSMDECSANEPQNQMQLFLESIRSFESKQMR